MLSYRWCLSPHLYLTHIVSEFVRCLWIALNEFQKTRKLFDSLIVLQVHGFEAIANHHSSILIGIHVNLDQVTNLERLFQSRAIHMITSALFACLSSFNLLSSSNSFASSMPRRTPSQYSANFQTQFALLATFFFISIVIICSICVHPSQFQRTSFSDFLTASCSKLYPLRVR